MTRTFFSGSWYADATPSGAFVVLYPQAYLRTHLGQVAFPPGEPWGLGYVRCTDVGGFRFAGQAHSTIEPACWEWNPYDGWRSFPQPCIGISPCIYDFNGTLHRSDGSVGSQGYRYVAQDGSPAGALISGDATYRLDLGSGRALFEWSAAGELLIGQAAYDGGGVQVWDGSTLRQLELGATTFVRVQWAGEQVAVSFMTPAGAVIIQTTLAELRALPPVVPPGKPPEKPPVDPHPPVDPPPVDPPPVDPPPVQPPIQPPKEPIMIAFGTPVPGFAGGDLVDNGNGTVSAKKPNGKYLCVTPDGNVEERDTPGGVWESFQQTPTALIAWREKDQPNDRVYVLPLVGA